MSNSVRPHRRQPTGSSVPRILQARTLEWVAISFSSAWKWKVKGKLLSHVRLLATPWIAAYQAPLSMGFSRQVYQSGVPLPSPPDLVRRFNWASALLPGEAHGQRSLPNYSPWGRRVGHNWVAKPPPISRDSMGAKREIWDWWAL